MVFDYFRTVYGKYQIAGGFSIFTSFDSLAQIFALTFRETFLSFNSYFTQRIETANIQFKDILLAYHISGTLFLAFIVSSHSYRVCRIIYLLCLSLLLCCQSTSRLNREKREQLILLSNVS